MDVSLHRETIAGKMTGNEKPTLTQLRHKSDSTKPFRIHASPRENSTTTGQKLTKTKIMKRQHNCKQSENCREPLHDDAEQKEENPANSIATGFGLPFRQCAV